MLKSPIEIFEKIVMFLKNMVDKDKVKVIYLDKFRFFDLDKNELELFLKKNQISESIFNTIVELEIPIIISSILASDNVFLSFFDKDDDEESKKIKEKKKILVEANLLNKNIVSNYLIKSSSKLGTLCGVDWEINKKLYDDTKGNIPELSYSIINMKLSDPSIQNILPSINSQYKLFNLVCNLDDIEFLIYTLEEIKKALTSEG